MPSVSECAPASSLNGTNTRVRQSIRSVTRATSAANSISIRRNFAFADLEKTSRTSMRIHVESWRRAQDGNNSRKVTGATFTLWLSTKKARHDQ